MKKFLVPLVVVLFVAGMVALGVVLSKTESPKGQLLSADITAADRAKGNPQAKVQIIEYGDMQCPACASYEPTINELLAKQSDAVYFAYRHLPLKAIHPNAEEGSYAVEAAHGQGKFWEMKSLVYAKQNEWANMPDPSAKFQEYAASLGLDLDKFNADYYSDAVKLKVESDLRTATEAGFNSTPTFVLNGQKINNPRSYDDFVKLIESAQPAPAQ